MPHRRGQAWKTREATTSVMKMAVKLNTNYHM